MATQTTETILQTITTMPVQLELGTPRSDELIAAAQILLDSFAESSQAIFRNCSKDALLTYRTSSMRHWDSLRQLSECKQIKLHVRTMVARSKSTGKVIGFAIWTREDDFSEEARAEREKETKLALPVGPDPENTDTELWNRCQAAFDHQQPYHLGTRPRCYVKYLCVDATVQRSGAGTALMKAIRKDAGNRPIFLEAADTPSAVRFYTKLGFENLGPFPVGPVLYTAMKLEPTTKSSLDVL